MYTELVVFPSTTNSSSILSTEDMTISFVLNLPDSENYSIYKGSSNNDKYPLESPIKTPLVGFAVNKELCMNDENLTCKYSVFQQYIENRKLTNSSTDLLSFFIEKFAFTFNSESAQTCDKEDQEMIYCLYRFVLDLKKKIHVCFQHENTDYASYVYASLKMISQIRNLLHLFEHFFSIFYNSYVKPSYKNLYQPNSTKNKPTLILDLDETLIKSYRLSSHNLYNEYDIIIDEHQIGVICRPYLLDFLKFSRNSFDLVLFSAGTKDYVNSVINVLSISDYFSRVYTREHCIKIDSLYLKSLKHIPHMNEDDCLIIDNNIFSFALDLDNGVLISSFHGEKDDTDLIDCIDHLKELTSLVNNEGMTLKEANGMCFQYESTLKKIWNN
jgi:Dullard-like phosphatase family protein